MTGRLPPEESLSAILDAAGLVPFRRPCRGARAVVTATVVPSSDLVGVDLSCDCGSTGMWVVSSAAGESMRREWMLYHGGVSP